MALGFCNGTVHLLKVPSPIINGLFISANAAPIPIHKLQAAYTLSSVLSYNFLAISHYWVPLCSVSLPD